MAKKNCYKFNTPGLWGHIIHTIPKQRVFFSIPLRTMKVLLSDFIQNMSQAPSKFWSMWIETDKWDDLKKLLVEFLKIFLFCHRMNPSKSTIHSLSTSCKVIFQKVTRSVCPQSSFYFWHNYCTSKMKATLGPDCITF